MNLIKNKKLLLQKKNMHEFHKKYDWYYNSKKLKNFIFK